MDEKHPDARLSLDRQVSVAFFLRQILNSNKVAFIFGQRKYRFMYLHILFILQRRELLLLILRTSAPVAEVRVALITVVASAYVGVADHVIDVSGMAGAVSAMARGGAHHVVRAGMSRPRHASRSAPASYVLDGYQYPLEQLVRQESDAGDRVPERHAY